MQRSPFSRKNWQLSCLLICLFQNLLAGQIAVELGGVDAMFEAIENTMTVVASDVPDSCLTLQASFGNIRKLGRGKYFWQGSSDTTFVTISIIDSCNNQPLDKRTYRVKELPVEIRLGGKHRGGIMGNGEFKAQPGFIAYIACCGFDARCEIIGFDACFFSKKTGELWKGHNTGARFEGAVLQKQLTVMPGDWIIFRHFEYRCGKQPKLSNEEFFFEIKSSQ